MEWLPRDELLTFEEIERIARVLRRALRLRLDPPHRRRAHRAGPPARLVEQAGRRSASTSPSPPTAPRCASLADDLAAAGLRRINISLDSLRPDRFLALTRRDELDRVLDGIDAALEAGLRPGEGQRACVMRGVNDDEVVDLAALRPRAGRRASASSSSCRSTPSGAWTRDQVVARRRDPRPHRRRLPLEPVGAGRASRPSGSATPTAAARSA